MKAKGHAGEAPSAASLLNGKRPRPTLLGRFAFHPMRRRPAVAADTLATSRMKQAYSLKNTSGMRSATKLLSCLGSVPRQMWTRMAPPILHPDPWIPDRPCTTGNSRTKGKSRLKAKLCSPPTDHTVSYYCIAPLYVCKLCGERAQSQYRVARHWLGLRILAGAPVDHLTASGIFESILLLRNFEIQNEKLALKSRSRLQNK